MDAATVKELADLGQRAGPRVVTADREPPQVYYTTAPDGTLTRQEAAPPPDNHRAGDPAAVCDVAKDAAKTHAAEVWFSRAGVVAVYADFGRAAFTLSPSPQMARLAEWDHRGRGIVKQAELILLLRTMFAGCTPSHPNLLESVRRVDTKKANDASSEVRQGKVSLSKSIVAEMSGIDKLPEEITFEVPVFAQAAVKLRGSVRVAVDPDPQNEQFVLVVLPGDIERATQAAEVALGKQVAELLEGSEVPSYYGVP